MSDVRADLLAEAERAGRSCTALVKLQRDLAETWANSPENETGQQCAERLLGVYVRAAYGLGYVDALTD